MITTTSSADTLAAARLLLDQMGIAPADLLTAAPAAPTFAEVVPQVRATLAAGTARTYGTHLTRLETEWSTRRLHEPSKADLEEMARAVQATARANRAARGGSSAAPDGGCPSASLVIDAGRHGDTIQDAYATGVEGYLTGFAGELAREHDGEITSQEARERAVLLLSRLVGAMALARAVSHVRPELSDEILRTCRAHALD